MGPIQGGLYGGFSMTPQGDAHMITIVPARARCILSGHDTVMNAIRLPNFMGPLDLHGGW